MIRDDEGEEMIFIAYHVLSTVLISTFWLTESS